jgi:hypothetical protein
MTTTDKMYRHIEYTEVERQLASMAREKAGSRDVSYHGTRFAQSILKTGVLFRAELGGQVCLTRSPEVAAYFGLLDRDYDEGIGSILILDRQSLETLYDISPNPQVIWHPKMRFHDEAEEEIFEDVINIGNHLIGIVSGPAVQRSDRHRALNDKYTKQVEAKLSILQRALKLGILLPAACYLVAWSAGKE